MKKLIRLLLGIGAIIGFFYVAFSSRLLERKYEINSRKIKGHLKIIQISDLHSCLYGEGQSKLVKVLEKEKPDFVVLSGDILDDKMKEDATITLLEAIGRKYNCFYALGNHEVWTGDVKRVKELFKEYGINVLDGKKAEMTINDNKVDIFGVDDPEIGEKEFLTQFVSVIEKTDKERFTVLISHRPELTDFYEGFKGDLVLSGHAHGGQWRIPYLLNGLYAPNQGFFPKYAGGIFKIGNAKMIVSRGLSKENTIVPRIFNRPEIVIIKVRGTKK